jgi:hypothetical protein
MKNKIDHSRKFCQVMLRIADCPTLCSGGRRGYQVNVRERRYNHQIISLWKSISRHDCMIAVCGCQTLQT